MEISDAKRKELFDFIAERRMGVIATVDAEGRPEAALMNLAVTPSLEILFETTNQTRKFANLARNPAVALVVGWNDERTLQYDGIAEKAVGAVAAVAREAFLAAFPEKASHQFWPGNDYFRVRPRWIRFSSYYNPRSVAEYSFPLAEPKPRRRPFWKF